MELVSSQYTQFSSSSSTPNPIDSGLFDQARWGELSNNNNHMIWKKVSHFYQTTMCEGNIIKCRINMSLPLYVWWQSHKAIKNGPFDLCFSSPADDESNQSLNKVCKGTISAMKGGCAVPIVKQRKGSWFDHCCSHSIGPYSTRAFSPPQRLLGNSLALKLLYFVLLFWSPFVWIVFQNRIFFIISSAAFLQSLSEEKCLLLKAH